uniref:Uncharacterized protein n=1 Tax=Laticauda laticaudata TaxID=8630 RepID=A0A8C5S3H4_LATLA
MCVFNPQAFPSAVLHPLPKRQALEKNNGASAVFNPSFLHYQQAFASAQLQQHASFIPTDLLGIYCFCGCYYILPLFSTTQGIVQLVLDL